MHSSIKRKIRKSSGTKLRTGSEPRAPAGVSCSRQGRFKTEAAITDSDSPARWNLKTRIRKHARQSASGARRRRSATTAWRTRAGPPGRSKANAGTGVNGNVMAGGCNTAVFGPGRSTLPIPKRYERAERPTAASHAARAAADLPQRCGEHGPGCPVGVRLTRERA